MCLCFSSAVKFSGLKTTIPINITIVILRKNIAKIAKPTVNKEDPLQNTNLVFCSLMTFVHSAINILTSQSYFTYI